MNALRDWSRNVLDRRELVVGASAQNEMQIGMARAGIRDFVSISPQLLACAAS
jgi:hypothetical protein